MSKCTPMQYEGGDGKCHQLVDLVPGARIALVFLCIFTFVNRGIIIKASFNRILGIWIAYRHRKSLNLPVQFPLRDIRFWSLIWKIVGSILMAVAYIDMWGILGHWTASEYLGMYAPAYGLLPFSTMLLQLNFMDRIYLAQKSGSVTFSKSYSIVTIVLIVLTALYSGPGFIIFGWVLRSAYLKDPNTKIGIVGNILPIVSCVLLVFNTLVCVAPSIWLMLKFGLFGLTRSEDMGRTTNTMITWSFRTVVIAGFGILNMCMFFYIKIPENELTGVELTEAVVRGLLPTIFSLAWARVFEIAQDYCDLDVMSSESVEVIPGVENVVMIAYGDGMGRYTSMGTTGKTKSMSMSNRRTSKSDYSRGATSPRSTSKDTDTDNETDNETDLELESIKKSHKSGKTDGEHSSPKKHRKNADNKV